MTAELFSFPEQAPTIRRRSRAKKETKVNPYSEEFESFWTLYPRKLNCSKFEASKAWGRLPAEMQTQAMQALPIFVRMCTGKDEQFICHAATWLNQRRFETVTPPIQPSTIINVNWPAVLRIYAATNNWNVAYGPAPGQPNCRVPKELLQNTSIHR